MWFWNFDLGIYGDLGWMSVDFTVSRETESMMCWTYVRREDESELCSTRRRVRAMFELCTLFHVKRGHLGARVAFRQHAADFVT